MRSAPLLHYETAIEPPINGGESILDGICSIGKQQVFQFQSNYSIRSLKQKQVSVMRYQYKAKQLSVTKIPEIKLDLFPKEVGLKSNKTRAKEA